MANYTAKSPLQMHCPKCGKYGAHKVIKTEPNWYHWGEETVVLFEKLLGSDIKYRVRQKQCCHCNALFESAEIPHKHFKGMVTALLKEIKNRETLANNISETNARLSDCIDDHDRLLSKVIELLASRVPTFLRKELGVPARIELEKKLSKLLRPATDDEILGCSYGTITKARTNLSAAERATITSERIFGPIKDYTCSCGKYTGVKLKGVICDQCGVEITTADQRAWRMGHIDLAIGIPSPISNIDQRISVIAVLPPKYLITAGLSCVSNCYDDIVNCAAKADYRGVKTAYYSLAEEIVPLLAESIPSGEKFKMLALAIGLCRKKKTGHRCVSKSADRHSVTGKKGTYGKSS